MGDDQRTQPEILEHPHVIVSDGEALVFGTRVPVRRLWAWHRKGVAIETLFKRYPSLGPAHILSAIAFAYDNQELIAADLAREANAGIGGAQS